MVWILILADLCGPHFRPQIQGEILWNFQAWANIQTFSGFTCCGLHWLWNLETIRVWYTLFSYKNLSSVGDKLITSSTRCFCSVLYQATLWKTLPSSVHFKENSGLGPEFRRNYELIGNVGTRKHIPVWLKGSHTLSGDALEIMFILFPKKYTCCVFQIYLWLQSERGADSSWTMYFGQTFY